MSAPGTTMHSGAYSTPLRVYERAPGTSPTGTPSGEWVECGGGPYWAQLVESHGAEVAGGPGPRQTRTRAVRLRFFPGFESVLCPGRRVTLGSDPARYGIEAVSEEPQSRPGTARTLRLDLSGPGA